MTEPLLLRIPDAARAMGVSRAKAYQLAAQGELPGAVRLAGGSLRVHRPTLERRLEELAEQAEPSRAAIG